MIKQIITTLFLMLFFLPAFSQSPVIDGYKVYYGTLHNHSSFSADASGDPEYAYIYARDSSKLDFFALTEHCMYLTSEEWALEEQFANNQNRDSVFTAFHGFEWSHSQFGHITILNTNTYSPAANPATDSFEEISKWVTDNNGLAYFNHPGRQNSTGMEFSHFTSKPNLNFVGIELWNRNNAFNVYYYNNGYFVNDGNLSFFDEANIRKWKIGASGSEDNHTSNWGNYSNFRLAVLAKANTRTDILDAMRKRHFYSTLDKNLVLSFKLSNAQMGDSAKAGMLPLTIEAFDKDNEFFNKVTLKKNGEIFKIWNINDQHPVIKDSIWCENGEYLYAIVSQTDGNEAISSPIYISNSNTLIIRDSVIVRDTIIIKDTIIFRDTIVITDTIINNDTISITDTLTITDTLRIIDTLRITDTIWIRDTLYLDLQNTSSFNSISVFPNPFTDFLNINNPDSNLLTILLYKEEGELILKKETQEIRSKIDTSHLKSGTYILSVLYKKKRINFVIIKRD